MQLHEIGVYIAGKTHDYLRVREVQELMKSHGWSVTHDWTRTVEVVGADHEHGITEQQEQEISSLDLRGTYEASLVVALGHPRICGTIFELGLATAWNKPVWLVDWDAAPRSVFWSLPNFTHLTWSELQRKVVETSPRLRQTRPRRRGTVLGDITKES